MKRAFIISLIAVLNMAAVFALPAIPAVSGAAKIAIGATAATVGAIAGNELPKLISKSGSGESTTYEVTKTDLSIFENGQTMKGEVRGYSTLKDVVDRIVSSTGGSKINRENASSALQKNNIEKERAQEISQALPSAQGSSRGQINRTQNESTGKGYTKGDVVGLWVAPYRWVYSDTPEGACGSPVVWNSSGQPECIYNGKKSNIFAFLSEQTISETDGNLCGSQIRGASFMCGTLEAPEVDGRQALVETLTDSDVQRVLQAMRNAGLLESKPVSFNLPSGRVLTVGSQGQVTVGDRPATAGEISNAETESTISSPVEGKPAEEDIMPDVDFELPTYDAVYEQKNYITVGRSGCLKPANFTAFGQTFEIPFDKMCEALSMVGMAIHAVAFFIAGRILVK